jgi:hypothetical protein
MNNIENWLLKKAREVENETDLQDLYTKKFMFGGSWVMDLLEEYAKEQVNFLENKTDWKALREKFFNQCTYYNEGLRKVSFTPHDLFEWFKKNIR